MRECIYICLTRQRPPIDLRVDELHPGLFLTFGRWRTTVALTRCDAHAISYYHIINIILLPLLLRE